MSFMKGWSLTSRLVARHFAVLGDNVAAMIASFDPETATEADRDALKAKLQDVAAKYSEAERTFQKEAADVEELKKRIDGDTNIAGKLAERLAAGQVTEAAAQLFCDELEAAKARLPVEIEEEEQARAFMLEIKSVMDEMVKRLEAFDKAATSARNALASANAQLALQQTRREQQDELRAIRGEGSGASTALGALQARASKLSDKAAGMRLVTDTLDKPAQDAARVDQLRKELAGQGAPMSALDRLKALSGAASSSGT